MVSGELLEASGNSVIFPLVVIRPILFRLSSVNQRLPSGPAVIPWGELCPVGTENSVIWPVGVMRPTWFFFTCTNQRLPSGPRVIPSGRLLREGSRNSVILPATNGIVAVRVAARATEPLAEILKANQPRSRTKMLPAIRV